MDSAGRKQQTYFKAFMLHAATGTATVVIGIAMHHYLKDYERKISLHVRLLINASVTFLSTLVVLLIMHVAIGYGGSMIDTTTSAERKRMRSFSMF